MLPLLSYNSSRGVAVSHYERLVTRTFESQSGNNKLNVLTNLQSILRCIQARNSFLTFISRSFSSKRGPTQNFENKDEKNSKVENVYAPKPKYIPYVPIHVELTKELTKLIKEKKYMEAEKLFRRFHEFKAKVC